MSEDYVESALGFPWLREELEALHEEHRKGRHRRAIYDDCYLCQQERNEAIGFAGPELPEGMKA